MKKIKVFTILIAAGAVLWGMGFTAWRLMDANERARIYLINAVQPLLREDLDIQRLDIGFGAIVLKGVTVLRQETNKSLYVEAIEIGYSLPHLLFNGFEPQNTAESIIIRKPVFTFDIAQTGKDTSVTNFFEKISLPQIFLAYGSLANKMDYLNRIAIEDGRIVRQNGHGDEEIASGISGWFMTGTDLYTEIGLQGKFFNSKKNNFSLSGLLDARNEDYRFWMQFDKFPLKQGISFLPLSGVDLREGALDGTFLAHYSGVRKDKKNVEISGDFTLTQGHIVLKKPEIAFSDIQAQGTVMNDSLVLNSLRAVMDDFPVGATGTFSNIFQPRFGINVSVSSLPISYLRNKLGLNIPDNISGAIALQGKIAGPVDSLQFDGIVSGRELIAGDRKISHINTRASFHNKTIYFKEFTGSIDILTVKGEGSVELMPGYPLNGRLEVYSNLDFIRKISSVLSNIEDRVRLATTFSGTVHALEGTVQAIFGRERERFNIEGVFQAGPSFSASGKGPEGIAWSVEKGSPADSTGWSVSVTEPLRVLSGVWEMPVFENLARDCRSEFSAVQKQGKWSFNSRAQKVLAGGKIAEFYSLSSMLEKRKDAWSFSSEVEYFPQGVKKYTAFLDVLHENGNYYVKRIEIPEVLQGLLTYEPASNNNIDGWFSFGTDINNLYSLFNVKPKFVKGGYLAGVVELEKNESGYLYHGDLELQNATLEDMPGYHALVKFHSPKPQLVMIDEYELEHPHHIYLWGSGFYDFAGDSVNLAIKGNNINADTLIATLSGSMGILTGNLDADLEMTGKIGNPNFIGTARLREGAIVGIRFDDLSGELMPLDPDYMQRIGSTGKSYHPRGMRLENCQFRRNGKYLLRGGGYLPFNKTDDLDLAFVGDGNLLAMLEDLSNGYFTESGSTGDVSFHIAGPFDSITLGGLSLVLRNGLLKAQSIIPEVRNVNIKAELLPESRFIRLDELSGDIGSGRLSISNSLTVSLPSSAGDSIRLEPFILADDGLTWGVLRIKTDSKMGYRFSIPGIQEPADWGTYLISGKNSGEDLYFAGPAEYPYVRGKALLRDVRLTYPLLETDGASREPSTVEKFLYRINWDVQIVADKNVEYFRVEPSSIPAIADNIYIRMNVNNGGNGLFFKGAFEDNSFAVSGDIGSTRGQLEFLDLNFRLEFLDAVFSEHSIFPEVSGRARTTIRDSTGVPREVYVIIYTTPMKIEEQSADAEWENLKFRLAMDKPLENIPGVEQTQEEVLQLLGYAPNTIMERAPDVAGLKADNALLRPIFRPMERSLRKMFQLDQVDIRPNLARNVTKGLLLGNAPGYGIDNSGLGLFSSGYLVLGKYFWEDFYFSYTGQLATGFNRQDEEIMGVNHLFGIEYRVAPGLLIQLEFDKQFNKFRNKEDTRFWIRRYFSLRN